MVKLKTLTLKKLLARRNLSQNAFARRISVSSAYMSQILSGERNPSPKLREKMLKSLNESISMRGLPPFRFEDLFIIRERS